MKTDDLINMLAADAGHARPSVWQMSARSLPVGLAFSVALFLYVLGLRSDLIDTMGRSWRFDFKLLVMLVLAGIAAWLVGQLARPEVQGKQRALLLLVPVVMLAGAVGLELVMLPREVWATKAVGNNNAWCLVSVPVLALAPLAAMLIALRQGAPSSPAACGAMAGLLAGGLGAALYGMHCWDDSPLFVALWYPPGIAAVTVLGALVGQRVLRW